MTPVICPAFSAAGAGDIVVRDSLYGFLFITQVALMQRAFHHADFFSLQIGKGMGDIFVDDHYPGERGDRVG